MAQQTIYLQILKNDTGYFCDKKQTNQRINVKFEIHTNQPIIQIMFKSSHHKKNYENANDLKKVVIPGN